MEKQIIKQVLQGDTQAFQSIIEKYQRAIYRYVLRMVCNPQDAEDLTQEIFIRCYNNLHQYDKRWAFSTWLYRVAVNLSINHAKKRRVTYVPWDSEMVEEGFRYNPEAYVDKKENAARIVRMMNGLKPQERNLLLLKYSEDISYEDMARILNVSEEAAKMKVYRVRKKLLKVIKEKGEKGGLLYEM